MPEPITAQLISNAWDDIKDAVAKGLAMPNPYGVPRPVLDTVAVVSKEKPSETKDWHHIQIPDAPDHVRVEESGNVIDIMHHYSLSYHELQAPDKKAIQEWATRARQFELSVMLRRYVQNAARHTYMANYLHQADPDGWGQRRFVVFGSAGRAAIPDRWDKADLENTVRVEDKPIDGIQVLVFRIAGGPYVRRPADLSLGWTPAADCAAELLLTEQLEFVNVQASTIIGIQTETPPPHEPTGTP
jgi:hypothetical protein